MTGHEVDADGGAHHDTDADADAGHRKRSLYGPDQEDHDTKGRRWRNRNSCG